MRYAKKKKEGEIIHNEQRARTLFGNKFERVKNLNHTTQTHSHTPWARYFFQD